MSRLKGWRLVVVVLLGVLLALSMRDSSASADNNRHTNIQMAIPTTTVPPGTNYGGLDVSGYCAATTGSPVVFAKGSATGPGFANDNWKCSNQSSPLNMQTLCTYTYGALHPDVVAIASSQDDANSWQCYANPANPSVAPIAASLGTPGQIFHSMGHNLVNALVTVAAMILIIFPANLFNHTFSANYPEILAKIGRARKRLRRMLGLKDSNPRARPEENLATSESQTVEVSVPRDETGSTSNTPGSANRIWFVGVLLVGSLMGGLLNPKFGMNRQSAINFVGTVAAFLTGAIITLVVGRWFRRHHHYPTLAYRRALPLGLFVALICVLISRLTNFQPGYLYGIVVSFAFAGTLKENHNAHLTVFATISTLSVASVAWMAWIPVNHLALEPGTNFIVSVLDDLLASLFIGGLVGTVIGLLPLQFMPGGTVAKWRKDVWAAVFFVALFLLIEVELRPGAGPAHPGGAPIVTAVVLFLFFGGLSFGMQRYFARDKVRQFATKPVESSE